MVWRRRRGEAGGWGGWSCCFGVCGGGDEGGEGWGVGLMGFDGVGWDGL